MNNKNILFLIGGFLLLACIALVAFNTFSNSESGPGYINTQCTADAMMCPDGSYVGRTGPNCEFVCPAEVKDQASVHGEVLLSPVCPVERIPPDPNCTAKPYQTTVTAIEKKTNLIISQTKTNTKGEYFFTLPAGDYMIRAESGAIFPQCEDGVIAITEGSDIVLNISCDTGIR